MDKRYIPVSEIMIERDPSVSKGYDFTVEDFYTFCTDDGVYIQDSMSIIHPLSDKSQKEITEKMMSVVSARGLSNSVVELSKEMYIGLYVLTKPKKKSNKPISVNNSDLEKMNDPYIMVSYRNHICTSGVAIFNYCFPQNFPFFTGQANKKIIHKMVMEVMEKYPADVFRSVMDKLSHEGFKWATVAGSSFTLDNLDIPKEVYKLKEKMNGADPETTSDLLKEAEKIIAEFLHDTGLGDIIESGSAKGYSQTMQILVAKGLISDLDGNILPGIGTSFNDGLTSDIFFKAGQGARVGMAGRAINTADTGYLARKLVYFLNGIELHPSLDDCGTDRFLNIQISDSSMLAKLKYRFVVKNGKSIPIEEAGVKVGDSIQVRSPIYCKSKKICHACHGKSYMRKATPYIGAMYALMLGESATQASMKKFHTGGAVEIKRKNIIKDMMSNDPNLKKDMLSKFVSSSRNSLMCKKDCQLSIDIIDLKMGEDKDFYYNEDTKRIVCNSIVSNITFDGVSFPILLDYVVELDVTFLKSQTKEELIFQFSNGANILYTSLEDTSMTALSRYLDRLIGGRIKFYNTEHLLSIVYQQYKDISPLPIVAFEVLISQILRYKQDPRLAARLGKTWEPILMNLKKSVFNEGFIQGLAFENINEALKNGLVQNTGDNLNILEKVFIGEKI